MSGDATKHYNVKIVKAILYVRKMTLNDDVVSAIEKRCLPARTPIRTLKPLQKHFWLLVNFTVGNKKTYFSLTNPKISFMSEHKRSFS